MANRSVRISTEMARGESLPTLTNTKGFRALLMLIEQSPEGVVPGKIYEMSLEEFRNAMNCRDDAHLKAEMEAFSRIVINWAKYYPHLTGYTVPLPTCFLNLETEIISFTFDSYFLERWRDNKLGFRRISWEVLVGLSSLYAAKIYEYCAISHEPGKAVTTRKLSMAEFRELLGVPPKAYERNSGAFFRNVETGVRAVNAAHDGFFIRYKNDGYGKNRRNWFEVAPAEKQERLLISTLNPDAPPKAIEPTRVFLGKPPRAAAGTPLLARVEKTLAKFSPAFRAAVEQEMRKQGFSKIPDNERDLKVYAGRLRGVRIGSMEIELAP